MVLKLLVMALLTWVSFHAVIYSDIPVAHILACGIILLAFCSFLIWFFSLGIFNKRTCGHESDSYRYVAGERMWMCHECYSEYTYDRLNIGR